MSNLTVDSSPDQGMRSNLPIAIVPLRLTDNWIYQTPATYLGDEQDVTHPSPGSFRVIRPPTVTNLIFVRAQCFTIDPVIVPRSENCFCITIVKDYSLTNVKSDRGFESWPGHEVKPPDWHSSLETHGQLDLPVTGHILCESAVLYHCAIKAFCTSRNNNWIQLLFREVQNAFIEQW